MEQKAASFEPILENLLRQYLVFKDEYDQLAYLQAFYSSCIIKIFPGKEDYRKSFFFPFGILHKNILKGRLELMKHTLSHLQGLEKDFILLRYFELQSRDFVMQYLRISSISTYKRLRRRSLRIFLHYFVHDKDFDIYFWDYQFLKKMLVS